ncbi:uracil-DNA glycosylase family protein [Candidatus Saccharibacteria bacterium]|nr:uracil-DNA glycosylase family protein [Candidatus Saccharibacteria bacterium]
MSLEELNREFGRMQGKYGAVELDAIYGGGCVDRPEVCFVFMNPTGRNVAAQKSWRGVKTPWLGTRDVWKLFGGLGLIGEELVERIRGMKVGDWTEDFAKEVYEDLAGRGVYVTNLAKCTQVDARELSSEVYGDYLELFWREMELVRPSTIVLFGNQVGSVVLGEKVKVGEVRRRRFERGVAGEKVGVYVVYYPVGNGRFNAAKAIEDLRWILERTD